MLSNEWMQVVRIEVMEKLNLKDFELSQSYLSFWDKVSHRYGCKLCWQSA